MSANKLLVDSESPEGPVHRRYLVIVAFLVLLSGLFVVFGLSRPRSAQRIEIFQITPPAASDAPATAAFTRDNVTVYVPPNAIDREGMLSIGPGTPNLFRGAQDIWTLTEVVIVEFLDMNRRAVSGITFPNPIEICFRLDEEEWRRFTVNPDSFQVHYYAEDKNPQVWEALPMTTHPEEFQVCGQTNHLSVFGLATRREASIPVTGPTLTLTPSPTVTRVVEPTWTNDRNRRDTATPIGVVPTRTQPPLPTMTQQPPLTNPPPTNPPPTNPPPTNPPPPTDPPPSTNPPPTDPPPTDPPPTTDPPGHPTKKPTKTKKP